MLQFVQPIWLLAAGGIILPLIIHLWNNQVSRTLKVGSIAMVSAQASPRARRIKLSQLLLLLIRCLLIIVLSLFLAGLFIPEQKKKGTEKGWMVMEATTVKEAYNAFKPQVDSLLKNGYALHLFQENFPLASLEKILQEPTVVDTARDVSYWRLLESLNQVVPKGMRVQLFTSNSLRRFSASRPRLSMNVIWHAFTLKDSLTHWTAGAFISAKDSIRLVKGSSGPAGISYAKENFIPARNDDAGKVRFEDGHLVIPENKALGFQRSILVDTASMHVAIYSPRYTQDAQYLQAAIEAIAQFSQRKMTLQVITDSNRLRSHWNWLFWLSDENLSPNIQAQNIFRYAAGTAVKNDSWIRTGAFRPAGESPEIYQMIRDTSQNDVAYATWNDGYGNTLLNLETINKSRIYHFYSRFNPAWNDLPWSAAFPAMLFQLMIDPAADDITEMDTRSIASNQLIPVKDNSGIGTSIQPARQKSLANLFWWITFTLFFLERIVSFQTRKNPTLVNG